MQKFIGALGAALAAGSGWIYHSYCRTKDDDAAHEHTTYSKSRTHNDFGVLSTIPNATLKKLEHKSIKRCNKLIRNAMVENGVPGATAAISVNGRVIYNRAFGFSDVENGVSCRPENVMRIASISKPLTAVAALQLWQEGKLDLDAPVQKYVPDFPEKMYNGERVVVTMRQLLCHTGGIRHYHLSGEKGNNYEEAAEYFITKKYDSVKDSLELFASDELVNKPGSAYHYTTYGWTLVSAVIEAAAGISYLDYMKQCVFDPLGLSSTVPDCHQPLIYNRTRHYYRTLKGKLCNTPYIDNSYKWGGGGFLSTAKDLVTFGGSLLAAYKVANASNGTEDTKYLLKPSTVDAMWQSQVSTKKTYGNVSSECYGLGWTLLAPHRAEGGGRVPSLMVSHGGGAVGATSILLLLPTPPDVASSSDTGIAVCVLLNLSKVPNIQKLGEQIAMEVYSSLYGDPNDFARLP